MDATQFEQLCRSACTLLGLDNPDLLRDEGVAQIDGIDMAVRFDAEDDEDALSFYVDLGLPAVEHRVEVYEELLQINLLHGTSTCATYALDKESGHMVSCLRFNDADQLDADFLVQLLRFYAEESHKARRVVENPGRPMFEGAEQSISGLAMNLA